MATQKTNSTLLSPIVTIHQPNFAPWPGYFNKMLMVDTFVYLDNVPYSKNSYQNRNRININGVPQWLTVPVITSGSYGELTREIRIDEQSPWRRKHLMTLRQNYGKAKWFSWVYERIEPIYQIPEELMHRFCISVNDAIRSMLGIEVPVVLASGIADSAGATERLIEIVKKLGGRTYISGAGGRKYLDEKRFEQEDIVLQYQQYEMKPYRQPQQGFVPGLSTLDLLFNLGPDAADYLRGVQHE